MNKDASMIAVYGRRGTGKTTLTRELLKTRERAIIFDPMHEYPNSTGPVSLDALVGSLRRYWSRPFAIAWSPAANHAEQLHRLSVVLWQLQEPYGSARDARQVTLVVEEMNLAYPASGLPAHRQGFTRVVLQGRHRGLSVIGVTQRPALVHPNFRSNVAESYVFPLEDENDRAVILRKIGRAHDAMLRALPPFNYLRLADGAMSKHRLPQPRKTRGNP